eukprot:scaffold42780_cov61-Phaeocystis_antarctica.AAC.2
MERMVATLDVSRLSGWLNSNAPCRAGVWSSGGGASSVLGGPPTVGAAGKARVERTRNTYCMFVTLDVSKLSGWLNADACCRVEREA